MSNDRIALNVVLINPSKYIRTEVRILAKAFAEGGHDVRVLTPSESEPVIKNTDLIDYSFFEARYVPGVRYTLPSPGFYAFLREHVADADVFFVSSHFYFPCAVATVVGRRLGVYTVVILDSIPGFGWTYGNPVVDFLARTYTHTLGRLVFAQSDEIVILGDYLIERTERFADPAKIRVIRNGVDTEVFRPGRGNGTRQSEANGGEDNTIELLYVGRLDPVKGIPYLLSAMKHLNETAGRQYCLTIVGDGTERDEYERRCSGLGIEHLVTFEGYQKDVVPYFVSHDIFVLPSLSEGQPTVLREAQACGTPVVSTDVGDARTLVKGGRIVPTEDALALAEGVQELADADLAELGDIAREHIDRNFSVDATYEGYLELCREAGILPAEET